MQKQYKPQIGSKKRKPIPKSKKRNTFLSENTKNTNNQNQENYPIYSSISLQNLYIGTPNPTKSKSLSYRSQKSTSLDEHVLEDLFNNTSGFSSLPSSPSIIQNQKENYNKSRKTHKKVNADLVSGIGHSTLPKPLVTSYPSDIAGTSSPRYHRKLCRTRSTTLEKDFQIDRQSNNKSVQERRNPRSSSVQHVSSSDPFPFYTETGEASSSSDITPISSPVPFQQNFIAPISENSSKAEKSVDVASPSPLTLQYPIPARHIHVDRLQQPPRSISESLPTESETPGKRSVRSVDHTISNSSGEFLESPVSCSSLTTRNLQGGCIRVISVRSSRNIEATTTLLQSICPTTKHSVDRCHSVEVIARKDSPFNSPLNSPVPKFKILRK